MQVNIEKSPKQYEKILNWYDANLYCDLLIIDNKNGWRLPTIEELLELTNNMHDFHDEYYWSSEIYNKDISCLFLPFRREQYYNDNNMKYRVRPIRNISN